MLVGVEFQPLEERGELGVDFAALFECDVLDRNSIAQAVEAVTRRFGKLDCLINGAGGAMGIVVGSVVDGVPESLILGIQVGVGLTISLGFVAAVFISNVPGSGRSKS